MAVLFMLGMVAAFIAVDIAIRVVLWKWREAKQRRAREEALDIGLRLDFTDEAPSLKRVTLEHPVARILAVDDEPVVLDSFRKILVYADFAVDTVETGQEALGLVQRNDYDFVFTDLKMPGMDGLEVLKGVKHFRPDIDVVMITGYATIESAVEAMKHGGMDYVQKPFTEDELVEFVNKLMHRRQARLEAQQPPTLRLVTPSADEVAGEKVYNIPSGVFVSSSHAWVTIETNGLARVGVDDFLHKIVGPIDMLELPHVGRKVRRGEPLFALRQGDNVLQVPAPVSGTVRRVNNEIVGRIELLKMKPYELGWVCCLEPSGLAEDLKTLMLGADAVHWYEDELREFGEIAHAEAVRREQLGAEAGEAAGRTDPETWAAIASHFTHAGNGATGRERPT